MEHTELYTLGFYAEGAIQECGILQSPHTSSGLALSDTSCANVESVTRLQLMPEALSRFRGVEGLALMATSSPGIESAMKLATKA